MVRNPNLHAYFNAITKFFKKKMSVKKWPNWIRKIELEC